MAKVVALLRGVNIGKRRLPMAALRTGLEEAGCGDVVTYVQSGNVVLTLPAEASKAADGGAGWLAEAIGTIAGFEVPVVLRTRAQLVKVVERNPYPEATGTLLHVLFYAEDPPADLLDRLDLASFAPEHATQFGREIYLNLPNGMGRSVLPAAVDKAAKAKPLRLVTARNWNTVLELNRLAV
jgi:uncharacterized protein (DUF1697 family)